MKEKRLYRRSKGAMLGGVCQGIADYFEVDSTLIRLGWVLISVFGTWVIGGAFVYLLCYLIIPEKDEFHD